jgi:hypothetical protein
MRAMAISNWAKRIALLLLCLSTRSIASAQTPQPADPNPHLELEASLSAGMTVWITDARGWVEKRQIVAVSGNVISTRAGDDVRRVRSPGSKYNIPMGSSTAP